MKRNDFVPTGLAEVHVSPAEGNGSRRLPDHGSPQELHDAYADRLGISPND